MRAIPQGIYIPNFRLIGSVDLSKVSEEGGERGGGGEDTTLSTIVPAVTRKRLVRLG